MLRASEPFAEDLTAIDWSQDSKILMVGDRNGYAYSVDANSMKTLGKYKSTLADKKNAWVQDIKIAPNN